MQQFSLEGRVALITGGSRGIGEAMALAMGKAGARVVICSRKEGPLQAAAERLQAEGVDARGYALNVGKPEEFEPMVEWLREHYGQVNILVNNAAANPVFGAVDATEAWAFDKIMDVNLKGPFMLSTALLPLFAEGSASIINVSSIGGLSPEPGLGIYSVSKAALVSLTKVMAKEWAGRGIRANVICPGLIKTQFSQALWQNEAILEHMMTAVPMGRMGTPEEIAGLGVFLAADASAYCTGAVFTADGGYLI